MSDLSAIEPDGVRVCDVNGEGGKLRARHRIEPRVDGRREACASGGCRGARAGKGRLNNTMIVAHEGEEDSVADIGSDRRRTERDLVVGTNTNIHDGGARDGGEESSKEE